MYLAFHPSDRKLYVLEGDEDSLAIRSVDADTRAVATVYPPPAELPAFLIPPPPSKDIPLGSSDAISSDDIKEGSIVGQIIGEGGIIAKSDYYFPASLQNLWQQGPSKFLDPMTRQKIVDVKWYKAHLVSEDPKKADFPEDPKGGRRTRKVKKVKKSRKTKKRTTYRKKNRTTRRR
jgi:hypothetical protein